MTNPISFPPRYPGTGPKKVSCTWKPSGMSLRKYRLSKNTTLSYEIPDGNAGDIPNAFKPGQDSTKAISVLMLKTDASYLATYKMPLKAGSFFIAPDGTGDSTNIVLNETAAQAFGWKDVGSAIGGQLKLQGYNGTVFTILGVTRDFQFGGTM